MSRNGDVLPHPDGDRLAEVAIGRAQRLACTVRDDGAYEVARITDPLSRDELVALCVALAAMVPLDRSAAELLAWIDEPVTVEDEMRLPRGHRFPDLDWTNPALELAHRTYTSGEYNAWSIEGERLWQAQQVMPPRRGRRKAS
jgi:hypothetical protein